MPIASHALRAPFPRLAYRTTGSEEARLQRVADYIGWPPATVFIGWTQPTTVGRLRSWDEAVIEFTFRRSK